MHFLKIIKGYYYYYVVQYNDIKKSTPKYFAILIVIEKRIKF